MYWALCLRGYHLGSTRRLELLDVDYIFSSTRPNVTCVRPYILVLDSLGGPHNGVFRSLRGYLQQELLARKSIERTIDAKEVPGKLAKVFHQLA